MNIKKISKKFFIIITLTIISISNLFSQSFEKKDYEGKMIENIILKGLVNTDLDFVIGTLTIKKGDIFQYKKSVNNFKELYDTGFFKNITLNADLNNSNNKVILTFNFTELPKIGIVSIEGENKIEEKDLISVMFLKPGNIYKEIDLEKDKNSILKLYKKKGFENTTIILEAKQGRNKNLVNIIIKINEGTQIYIESIRIIGAKNLDADEIYEVMKSQESHIFSKNILDPSLLNEDRKRIEQFMKNKGYWFANVKNIYIRKDYAYPEDKKDKKKAFIIIVEIVENDQYKMGKINIRGNTIFKTKELRNLIKISEGDIYNDSLFKSQLINIQNKYRDQGYIQTKILPIPLINKKNKIINWELEIIEGEQVHIRNIKITGYNKTKIWVIDQELQIKEGELFQYKKLINTINSLRNTEIFSSVIPNPEPTNEDGLIDLKIRVTEQRTTFLNFGAGYGTISGFSFFEEVKMKNLFGTGWTLSEKGEFGANRIHFQIGTSTKWLVPYIPVSFSSSFRFTRTKVDPSFNLKEDFLNQNENTSFRYRLQIFEFDTAFGYYLLPSLQIYTGFLLSFAKSSHIEKFTLNNIDTSLTIGQSLFIDLETGIAGKYLSKLSHRIGIIYDTRNYIVNPSSGFWIKGILEYTGGIYSGNSNWIKWKNSFTYYLNPIWKIILAFYANYEIIFKQFNGEFNIRDTDRLRFDGTNELRGWKSSTREILVGNGGKLAFSFETRIPLFASILWGVLFIDAGDLSKNVGSFPTSLRYYSIGGGLRLQLSILPIRIYFANKADYSISTPKKFTFHKGIEFIFTIGGYF